MNQKTIIAVSEGRQHCSLGKKKCPICKRNYNVAYYRRKKVNHDRVSISDFLVKAIAYNKTHPIQDMTASRAFVEHEIYNGRMVLA